MPVRFEVEGVRVTVHTNCKPVRWMKKRGLTIGSHIFLSVHAWEVWPFLLAHEFGHVLQWKRLGFFRFLWEYAKGLRDGEYEITDPLEAEAHAGELAWARHPAIIGAVQALGGRV